MAAGAKRLRALIKGELPAGFKPRVRAAAVKRGIKGFCDFTPDKKFLEVVGEGSESALKDWLEEIKKELAGKPVEVSVEWSEATGKYKAFRLDRAEEA